MQKHPERAGETAVATKASIRADLLLALLGASFADLLQEVCAAEA